MKIRSNSLAVRLVRWLAIAQIGSVILGMAAWMMLSPYVTYTDVAADQSRRIVAAALRLDAAGPRIVATNQLLNYAETRPGFVYAAISKGEVAAGSSPLLVSYLERLGPAIPSAGRLEAPFPGGGQIAFEERVVDGSPVVIATAGNRFGLEDISSLVAVYLRSVITIFAPAVLSALLVIPLVVHRQLAPLRRAGREAEGIGFESLDRRLSVSGLTREVAPFVAAINALLDRLAQGAARQRRFSANAAHELRTPAAILSARLAGMPDFQGKEALERDTRRMTVLVDQLLAAARLSHRENGSLEPVQIDAIARDVVANCAPLAIRRGRDIAFEGEPVEIYGDAPALTSAITNLVDNAIRAEPPGGTVEVEAGRSAAGRVFVEVRDHGRGVPETERERLFEPFWRKGEPGTGTGLGLAIVREIAEAHGGVVTLAPQTERVGAIFRIELPSRATKAVHQPEAMLST